MVTHLDPTTLPVGERGPASLHTCECAARGSTVFMVLAGREKAIAFFFLNPNFL